MTVPVCGPRSRAVPAHLLRLDSGALVWPAGGRVSASTTACLPHGVSCLPCTLQVQSQLKYYNPAVHAASFVLPVFAERTVAKERRPSLPHVASSVVPALLTRSSLALAACGAALGAAAAVAMLRK